MNNLPHAVRIALWSVLVAAQVGCISAPTMTMSPSPSHRPTDTQSPVKTSTRSRTPTPGATFTPTPLAPTATGFPTATPTAPPRPTSTPFIPVTFKTIHMIDTGTGWAMADIGTDESSRILRTEDGGDTWGDVSPMLMDFVDSFVLDARTAWVWTRGAAWRTLDGGESWEPLPASAGPPYVGFTDSQHGWQLNAEEWGLSFRQFDVISFSITQDGGITWQETNPPPSHGVAYMAYPSARTAWAIRAGFAKTIGRVPNLGVPFSVDATFDGGGSWTTHQMPLPPGAGQFRRPYEGSYLGGVGNCEFISPVYTSVTIWKLALTCEDRSWMYTSTTQGGTWIISDMPAGIGAHLDFIDASTGWLLVGDPYESPEGHLYGTTDGGGSWTLLKRTGWADARMSFVDARTGWAVACTDAYCYQRSATQALIETTDGGRTWRNLDPEFIH